MHGALVSVVLAVSAGILAIPVAIFFVEIIAGLTLPYREGAWSGVNASRSSLAVLVPAHNESRGLLPTLEDIKRQLRVGDRLVVVADNCTDDTAAVAHAAGAEVIERADPTKRGKGYALDFGVQYLSLNAPAIVLIIDADCRLGEACIERLASTCAVTHRPSQALYLMTRPIESQVNYQVAEFAWRVKNWLRPQGLNTLGLPCQLVGTGMAFPWEVLRLANLANGWLVEDLKLGLELAAAGAPPVFCQSACVTSQFAFSIEGSITQRERWEQGHISTILTSFPRLLGEALKRRNWELLALSADLLVPPLSLLSILLIASLLVSGLATLFSFSSVALIISAVNFVAFAIAVILAWMKHGREILPPEALASIPLYVLRKLHLYFRILCNKTDAEWIKTNRKKS